MSFLLITNLDMVLEHMKEKIGYRWILRTKFKADGSIDRHKAYLVAKGYTQQAGIGLFGNLLTSGQVNQCQNFTLHCSSSEKLVHVATGHHQ